MKAFANLDEECVHLVQDAVVSSEVGTGGTVISDQ